MSVDYRSRLMKLIDDRAAVVAIVGLGYVGLPLASAIWKAGYQVIGLDISQSKIDAIEAGRSPVEDLSDQHLVAMTESGRFKVSPDIASAAQADVAVIAVPTPIDEHRVPDLSAVIRAAHDLAESMRKGSLVVLESTTYPGTTEEIVIPAFGEKGFIAGVDLFAGYSPERVDPGNKRWNIHNTPKVVAGFSEACASLVSAFYSSVVDHIVPVTSMRTAEATKLFENIFRIVNIALVNEFDVICERFGIDAWEVIEACATKPFGFMPFYPGPGLGGHCVPVDPFYLAWKAREKGLNTEFIELAGKVNAGMPRQVVDRLLRLLNGNHIVLNGARIGLLGVAYKKNVGDTRESAAIPIIELLLEQGALVSYHDPHVPALVVDGRRYESSGLTPEYLSQLECALIVADHDAIAWPMVSANSRLVLDTRNVLRRSKPVPRVGADRRD